MSQTPVTVRLVRLADAAHLRENIFSMNTLEQTQSMIGTSLSNLEQDKGFQLVADVEGKVVGTVMLQRHAHPFEAHRAELFSLVVHPSYQGQGIARQLVAESRQRAIAVGIRILEVYCRGGEPVERIYPRFGFREYGRLPQGIIESWGEHKVFDAIYFYQPLAETLQSV